MRKHGALGWCDISAYSCLRAGAQGASWVSEACDILTVQPEAELIEYVYS